MSDDKNELVVRSIREAGWFWINNIILDEYQLDPYDLAVYVALARYSNNNSAECWPSLTTLAEKTNMSVPRVIEATKTLERLGLISITRMKKADGNNHTNVYTLLTPKDKVLNNVNKGTKPRLVGVLNDVNTNKTQLEKDLKDIAPQSVAEVKPDLSGNTKNDGSNTQLLAINNPDWDLFVTAIDAGKSQSPVSYKSTQPDGCQLPNLCEHGGKCSTETCVIPDVPNPTQSIVADLKSTHAGISEIVRDVAAPKSKAKGSRKGDYDKYRLTANQLPLAQALANGMYDHSYETLVEGTQHRIVVAVRQLYKAGVDTTEITRFCVWLKGKQKLGLYQTAGEMAITTLLETARNEWTQKSNQQTVFVSNIDEKEFPPMSLD